MQALWKAYAKGERFAALLLLSVGVLSLLAGNALLALFPVTIFKGMGWSIVATGVLEALKGIQTWWGIRIRAKRVAGNLPARIPEERDFMRLHVRRINYMQTLDLLIFLAGIGLALGGSIGPLGDFALGCGITLSFQAGFLLTVDLFAGLRNGLYLHQLEKY